MLATEKRQLFNSLEKERAKTEQLKAAIRSALNKQLQPSSPSYPGEESSSSRPASYEHALDEEVVFPPPPRTGSARHPLGASASTSSAASTPRHVVGGVIVPGEIVVPPPLRPSSIPRRRSLANTEFEGRPLTDRMHHSEQWSGGGGVGGGGNVRASHDGVHGGRGTWKENDVAHNSNSCKNSNNYPAPSSKRRPEPKQFQSFSNPQAWNGSTVVTNKVPSAPRGRLPPPPKPASSPRRARVPRPPSAPREAWGGSVEAAGRVMRSNRAQTPPRYTEGGDSLSQDEGNMQRLHSSEDGRQSKSCADVAAKKPAGVVDSRSTARRQENTAATSGLGYDLPSLATSWIGAGESAVGEKRVVGEGQWLGGFMEENGRDKLRRLRAEMTQIASLVRSGDSKLPVEELRR